MVSNQLASWYAVYVKPRHEKNVDNILRGKGYESFLPVYRSRRSHDADLPLFPCYVFCRISQQDRLPVLTIPGVFFIVGVGKAPVPIDDHEISSLKAIVASGFPAQPSTSIAAGDKVRIDAGPLRGVQGYLERTGNGAKLIVSISLLQRSVAVSIDADCVTPVASMARRAAAAL